MRHIGELEKQGQAEAFASYLLVQGIESQLDPQDTCVEVWIKDEDHFDRARKELEQFKSRPDDPKYTQAVPQAKKIVKEEQQRMRQIQKRIVNVSDGGIGRSTRVTISLIVISAVVALWTNFGNVPVDHQANRLLQFTAIGPPESQTLKLLDPDDLRLRTASLQRGQVWRLVSPMFIHYGAMHIVFNMYMLFVFGTMIERRYGSLNFLWLVLLTSAISTMAQALVPGGWQGSAPYWVPESAYIINAMGGMSGVVYGLFGFIWMKAVYDPNSNLRMNESTVLILMIWLVGCIFAEPIRENLGVGIFPANVANWAHGMGLVVGAVIGYVGSMLKR